MKATVSLSDRKIALVQRIFEVNDVAMLEQLEDFMGLLGSQGHATVPIPHEDLAAIALSIEESKTIAGTPLDEYLEEMEAM